MLVEILATSGEFHLIEGSYFHLEGDVIKVQKLDWKSIRYRRVRVYQFGQLLITYEVDA